MKFKIFKKTGEFYFVHDGIYDYDGDNGYWTEIDVPREKVKTDVWNIVCSEYSLKFYLYERHEIEAMKDFAYRIIDDNDFWDALIENYSEQLQSQYEGEYSDD